MPITISPNPTSDGPKKQQRRMRASDIPDMMRYAGRREHLPYSMLAKEWECWPADREKMVADPPACENPDDLCRIAAVVHALCARDGVPVPDWVFRHRSEQPLNLFPMLPTSGPIWDRIRADAPESCEMHNVWFDSRSIAPLSKVKGGRLQGWWRRFLRG